MVAVGVAILMIGTTVKQNVSASDQQLKDACQNAKNALQNHTFHMVPN